MSEVTRILQQIERGNRNAACELFPLVYAELCRLASYRMRNEQPGLTLQPTALVHEAYIRLIGDTGAKWDSRAHFFGAAAQAMRRILIESARHRKSLKQGGDAKRRELLDGDAFVVLKDTDKLLDLDAALTKLSLQEPELAKLVELRYFAGLTVEEAAETMEISARTVKRYWAFARAWLGREMNSYSNAAKSNRHS